MDEIRKEGHMKEYYIETDEKLKSMMKYGTKDFPFAYYYDEINRYREKTVEWHWHNGLELSFVVTGPVECCVGKEKVELHSGDAVFVNHGVIHRFVSHSGGVLVNYIFDSDFIAPFGSRIHTNYVLPIVSSNVMFRKIATDTPEGRRILYDLIRIQNELEIGRDSWELHVQSVIADAWCELYGLLKDDLEEDTVIASKKDGRTYARIRKMLNYIHMHYEEDINLEQIAEAVCVSKSESLRCFKATLQITPMAYLTQYRLGRAEKMLAVTDESILEVAQASGFDNSSYFCKVFKKYTGMSPMEFRRMYGGDQELK